MIVLPKSTLEVVGDHKDHMIFTYLRDSQVRLIERDCHCEDTG